MKRLSRFSREMAVVQVNFHLLTAWHWIWFRWPKASFGRYEAGFLALVAVGGWVLMQPWLDVIGGLLYGLALLGGFVVAFLLVGYAAGFSLLPAECRQLVLQRLSDRIVVMHFRDEIERVGEHGEHVVAVHDGTRVIGLGDVEWFRRHRPQVQQLLAAARSAQTGTAVDDEADLAEAG